MYQKLLLLFALFSLVSCNSTGECSSNQTQGISEFKPAVSKDRKDIRDGFVGQWISRQATDTGGMRHSIIERHEDSRFVVEFKIFDENERLTKQQKEFGYWGVAGGVYFTMFRGWIENDELKHADPDNPYYYDSYEIVEVSDEQVIYKSLTSDNVFTYTKLNQ